MAVAACEAWVDSKEAGRGGYARLQDLKILALLLTLVGQLDHGHSWCPQSTHFVQNPTSLLESRTTLGCLQSCRHCLV